MLFTGPSGLTLIVVVICAVLAAAAIAGWVRKVKRAYREGKAGIPAPPRRTRTPPRKR